MPPKPQTSILFPALSVPGLFDRPFLVLLPYCFLRPVCLPVLFSRGYPVPPAYELVAIEAASALEPIIDPGPMASPPESLSLSQFDILFLCQMHSYQQQLERQQSKWQHLARRFTSSRSQRSSSGGACVEGVPPEIGLEALALPMMQGKK
ncbi:hypothetical protein VitviT2T_015855 [Vitis vinifera]|uniref:Uncharacterized protein n=1 Tax=Vitis vinifera TaxID=29760 RepID=A0ABY9CNY9_VITVI|nr:hypothetical protein VitviT2T_015855 [Vitis vinifera]